MSTAAEGYARCPRVVYFSQGQIAGLPAQKPRTIEMETNAHLQMLERQTPPGPLSLSLCSQALMRKAITTTFY
ncbi:hypothetical protein CP49_40585 [Bradyrhizobium valentinum]|uniref:Uncharacterized protein n=1 Tax=Bradyrhizobium valentinum TaxID=1518501 RepID=A0A0R3LKQ0_9BRAD|nr:hypothetical protein CP49_40585 [Bradyrhizobium valentinum]